MEYTIYFTDLNYNAQQDIIEEIKRRLKEQLEEEAKEKNKSLEQLMWQEYDLDYELKEEDKKKVFYLSLDEFLEEKAENIINNQFRVSIILEI
ncbi:MAG: hypothetical protein QXY47_05400 [Thermoplasmata archaeon]